MQFASDFVCAATANERILTVSGRHGGSGPRLVVRCGHGLARAAGCGHVCVARGQTYGDNGALAAAWQDGDGVLPLPWLLLYL